MLKVLLTGMICLCAIVSFSQDGSDSSMVVSAPDSAAVSDALSLTVRDNSRITLQWRALSTQNEFFSIERSCNGKDFETIAVLKQQAGVEKLEWTDEQPAVGKNLYRIRYSFVNGSQWYTRAVIALVSGSQAFRFYPNPADNMLIVRSEYPVDLSIVDGNGKLRLSQSIGSGLQTLNVSYLEKGVYLLRIFNRQTNQVQQEKLVKN